MVYDILLFLFVSDITVFVLKRGIKFQLTNSLAVCMCCTGCFCFCNWWGHLWNCHFLKKEFQLDRQQPTLQWAQLSRNTGAACYNCVHHWQKRCLKCELFIVMLSMKTSHQCFVKHCVDIVLLFMLVL